MKTLPLYLIVALILISVVSAQAQNWQWVDAGKATANASFNDVAKGPNGNVYVTGSLRDSLQLGDTSYIDFSPLFGSDPFFAKYNSQGKLTWGKHFETEESGAQFGSILKTTSSGKIILAGKGNGPIHFSNQTDTFNKVILTKFNNDGRVIWSKKAKGNPVLLEINDMALDQKDNIYLTGGFTNSVTFGNQTVSSNGGADIFLMRMKPDGQVTWLKNYGGSNTDKGKAVTLDKNGNIYLGATFGDSITLGNEKLKGRQEDAMAIKMNAQGTPQWAVSGGAPTNDEVTAIAVDTSGNVFLQGNFTAKMAYFASDTFSTNSSTVSTSFLAKYTQNSYQWAELAKGTRSNNVGKSLFPDNQGGCLVAGACNWRVKFGDTALKPSKGTTASTYLAYYNDTGHVSNAALIDLLDPNNLKFDGSSEFFIAGQYQDTLRVGGETFPKTNGKSPIAGSFQLPFQNFSGTDSRPEVKAPDNWKIYPNPTKAKIYLHKKGEVKNKQVQVVNQTGRPVIRNVTINHNNTALDLSHLSDGVYFIRLIGEDQTLTKPLIKY